MDTLEHVDPLKQNKNRVQTKIGFSDIPAHDDPLTSDSGMIIPEHIDPLDQKGMPFITEHVDPLDQII